MSHDANRTAQNIKAFSKGLATSSWIPFIFWQFCLNCRRTQPGLLLTSCSPASLSWNGNLTEHLRHKKVRQRYKCLHPARFVSEPRSCSGCATVRFLSLSGGAQSANSTTLKQARRLAKASWFALHARRVPPSWIQPLFKVIWRGFIVWPRWLTHTFTSFLPALITFSTFLTSDRFLTVFFPPAVLSQ